MYSQLETLLMLSRRNGRPASLLLADVDHFKKYNDEFGTTSSDTLLATGL
jgi:diguanylate cyclase (GGDEF)-like protein